MVGSSKGKKSPTILFFCALFAILVVMFVASYRSALEQQLDGPPNGVKELSTIGDSLVAISRTGELCVWDWNNITAKPRVESVNASNAIWLPTDHVVWVPSNDPGTIVISNRQDGKEVKRLSLGYNWQCDYLSTSRDGQFVALAAGDKAVTGEKSDFYKRIHIATIGPDLDELHDILTTDERRKDLMLRGFSISDDGTFIAMVGQKDGLGWIGAVDVKQRQLIWEQALDLSVELMEVAFSPDGHIIYTGGVGRRVFGLETTTGKVLREWEMADYMIPGNKRRLISCIAASPNGRYLAAGTEPVGEIYIWDIETGDKVGIIKDGATMLNALTFSPDSRNLVTGGLMAIRKVKIWRIPKVP